MATLPDIRPFAKVVDGVVRSIQQINSVEDNLDGATWVDLHDVFCSDGSTVAVGCSYADGVFTSLPRDIFNRSVSMYIDGDMDIYSVTGTQGVPLTVVFASGTSRETVYATLNVMHVPELADAITSNLLAFNAAIKEYTGVYFPTDTKLQFFIIYYMAGQSGKTNRAAYIQPLFNWASSILVYATAYAARVSAMTDVAAVLSTTWDIPGNTLAVPNVTLSGAIAITD